MKSPDTRIPARLQARLDIVKGLAIFRFALDRDFHFLSGQYATLWLTHHDRTIPRPYSIASSPSETRVLELYISKVEEGELTPSLWSREVLRNLKSGSPETSLSITGPRGRFLLERDDPRDLVFVGSGTGVAPFISMTRALNEEYLASPNNFRPRKIFIIHGARSCRSLGYHRELERLAGESLREPGRRLSIVYLPTVSRAQFEPEWKGLKGRAESLFEDPPTEGSPLELEVTVRRMFQYLLRPETHAVYVCGHAGTVDNVAEALRHRGFKLNRDIKREKYYA